jgi:hypothetical protein
MEDDDRFRSMAVSTTTEDEEEDRMQSEPVATVEDMKRTVVQYGEINGELKKLQEESRKLRLQRENLSSTIRSFMQTNQLTTCHISQAVNTSIRKIRFVERESKERVTVKMIEEWFGEFFASVDNVKFLNLTNAEKSQAFFEYMETKRSKKILRSIIIR